MIEIVMLGAGGRGYHTYGNWILQHADQIRVVAVRARIEAEVAAQESL